MAATPSNMLPLGTPRADFRLPDTDGSTVGLADFDGKRGLLVMFICNHCPFVIHIRDQIAAIGREYGAKNVGVVAISSNDVANYPDDSPEKMSAEKAVAGYTFPYLYDETQAVAKAYQAACTPDFFLFDDAMRLIYRGQLDASRPNSDTPVTGEDLRAALDALLAGRPVSSEQHPSIGCNIKWITGNEPTLAR